MAGIPQRLVARAIAARLATVTNATGWYGQIGAAHGLPGVEDTPAAPLPKSDDDLRVRPYFVVFPDPGTPSGVDVDLGDTLDDAVPLIRITAAGGDVDDVLALVERIHSALHRWEPVLELPEGADPVQCGPLRPPPGFRPTLLFDRDMSPARPYVALQYQLTVHN